ncbi:MAG: MmgE/PrpD family protein [Xanthobacteraceae bacterium]
MTPLDRLAEWVSTLTPDCVPVAQHRLVRLRLIDTLGLIAVAADHEAGRSLCAWANANSGSGATVLVSGARAAPEIAALAHGSLAHARDFDDTFIDSVIHPGSTVIPAALAVAESLDVPFELLSTAIVAGYEVAARLGAIAGRGFHARGFHATGIVGPIAASAAAGVLTTLDQAQLADAFGLSTSMSSGLLAFLGDGGWSKWLHTGWSAHGGIIAGQLAQAGFRGPRQALDHQYGLFGAFLGNHTVDFSLLTTALGEVWRGESAQFKLYPCAHVIQPYIDAAFEIVQGTATVQDIAAVRCVLAPWALPIVGEPRSIKTRPRNDLEAIASLPFMVAAALIDGKVDLDTLKPETIRRPEIRQLAARVYCEPDAALGIGFDGRMHVEFRDGGPVVLPVAIAPASETRIIAKFHANTAHCRSSARDALLDAVLQGAPRSRDLVRLATAALAHPAPAPGDQP